MKFEDLYQREGGLKPSKSNQDVATALVKEYIPSNVSTARVFSSMKPVHLDGHDWTSTARELKKKQKLPKKIKAMNAKERRALGVYDVSKSAARYELFIPLHELWLGYIRELYEQGTNAQIFGQKMLKADFHGALLEVIKSTNPALVSQKGIVVQETQNLFRIVTKDNKLKHIPKAGAIFAFDLPMCNFRLTLYGQQLLVRAADRAAKKFKPKPTIDL
ncbi:Rof/RNase P-like protein [Dichotomocladium elegans]|nr:Rof/RNase P-like protein [Dichotomocladium elegans]